MIVLGIASLVVIGLTIWLSRWQQRTDAPRERLSPAHGRARQGHADAHGVERELKERQRRVEQLQIRALTSDERDGLTERWRSAQVQFVDDPAGATRAADALVAEVMQLRGYPVGDLSNGQRTCRWTIPASWSMFGPPTRALGATPGGTTIGVHPPRIGGNPSSTFEPSSMTSSSTTAARSRRSHRGRYDDSRLTRASTVSM